MTIHRCLVKYNEAVNYIQDGDVLLFRGTGLISLLIQVAGEGYYSHAALATWTRNEQGERERLECVEFREWIGSRVLSLENYVKANPACIDVFRPVPRSFVYVYNCKMRELEVHEKVFNPKPIINEFRSLTGLPYGWNRIWWLARHHMIGLRLLVDPKSLDDSPSNKDIYPVCSTIISHLFSKHYVDLIRFRSDSRTEPSDLARSPLLNYIFTLVP